MAHDLSDLPSGNILVATGYTLGQLASGVHHEAVAVNASGAVSTLDFAGKSVLQFTVTGNLSGSYTLPPLNGPALTQNASRSYLFVEYTQDATGGWSIPLATLFANAGNATHMGNPSVDLAPGGRTRVKLIIYRAGGVTLCHAEFIPQHVHTNISVATQHSLTGGGDLSTSRTLALTNDTASPGNNKVYGTDGAGARGWKNDPAGGGGSSTLGGLDDVTDVLGPTGGQVLQYNSGTSLWQAGTIAAAEGSGTFVDSIAALQGIASPVDKQIVFVRGYYAAGDGGHGTFMYQAAMSDEKMVTAATVSAGGTGYSVGHVLSVNSGTPWDSEDTTLVRVVTLSGSAVATVFLEHPGYYSTGPATSNVATAGAGTGTGCTLNLTVASAGDWGTWLPKASGGVGRWMRQDSDKLISVKAFGAKGDGTNTWEAMQRALWSTVPLYVPPGNYKVNRPLTFRGARPVHIEGAQRVRWGTASIELTADTEEPLLHRFGVWMKQDGTYHYDNGGYETPFSAQFGGVGRVILKDVSLISYTSIWGSACEVIFSNDSYFENVSFGSTFRGLTIGNACFDTTVLHCLFVSDFKDRFAWAGTTGGEANRTIAQRAWAIMSDGHSFIYGASIAGNGVGFVAVGADNTFSGARIEVCCYGIILSNRYFRIEGGVNWHIISRSSISAVSLEANLVGVWVQSMTSSSIRDIGIQGSPVNGNRPIGEIGLLVTDMDFETSSIENLWANGDFIHGGILNRSRGIVQNATSSGTIVSYGSSNGVFNQVGGSHPTYRAVGYRNEVGSITAFSDLMLKSLTGLNLRDGQVNSRNFGDVVSVTTSATTAAVTFPTLRSPSTYAFNTIAAISDGGSTLVAGTYYYATTVVDKGSEHGINYWIYDAQNQRTAVVSSGQAVQMTFNGGTVPSLIRRVYRTTRNTPEVFEGYWEITNTGSGFTDNGTVAFTRNGAPPVSGDITSMAEVDTNYQIILTPSWNTTAWITAKATTGFTMNFGTAAPGSATCAWLMFRP